MEPQSIRFLIDENLRGHLLNACREHNRKSELKLDVEQVGDFDDLPISTLDPDILRWAEEHGRILITKDKTTMPGHFRDHLATGRRSPGVLILRPNVSLAVVVETMLCIAHATERFEWIDRLEYIP